MEVAPRAREEAARVGLRHPFRFEALQPRRLIVPRRVLEMRRAAVGFGDPERASGRSLAGRLPQVSVSVRPVVGVDVVGVEVGPGLVREHAFGVGGRRHGRGGVPADDDLRITGLEPEPRRLLPRTHLVHRVRAEGGDVGLVPRLPRRDPAFEAHGQRPTEFINAAQISGKPAAGLGLGLRPGRRVVEDLKHLQARSPMRVRGTVVGGGRRFQRAGLRLNLPPAQPVADPAHTRERGEVRQLLLFRHVIVREPGGGGVNGNRRVLRCAGLQRSQNRERGPALVRLIGGTEFEPVPADTQDAPNGAVRWRSVASAGNAPERSTCCRSSSRRHCVQAGVSAGGNGMQTLSPARNTWPG